MARKIIADVSPAETRVAILDDGRLSEIEVEARGDERLVGNIYKGRVANILPGMQAAFVDIGLDRNAFLYAGDIAREDTGSGRAQGEKKKVPDIRKLLRKDEEILVQVVKQPGGTKGARVTTNITLPGRLLVLTPTTDHVGVSRRICSDEEAGRLREMINRARPGGVGVILRTAAAAASEHELAAEIRFYSRLWERIQAKAALVSAPRLIHAEQNLLFRTVRDVLTDEVEELVIDNQDAYERARALAAILDPAVVKRIKYYGEDMPIFDYFGVEPQIEQALHRKVWLKSGSYLVFDEAEALTVIDVNTGKYTGKEDLQETILHANLEAADEIARQLRLRDLSGIIIIDFIDMESPENRRKVLERLKKAVGTDRTKTTVVGFTQLGLVEMTRKRLRKELSSAVQTACPTCGGTGRVASTDTVIRKVRLEVSRIVEHDDEGSYLVEVAPPAADQILLRNNHDQSILGKYPRAKFYVKGVPGMHPNHVRLSTIFQKSDLEGAHAFH